MSLLFFRKNLNGFKPHFFQSTLLLLCVFILYQTPLAAAEEQFIPHRPADTRLNLPAFPSPQKNIGSILPPLALSEIPADEQLTAGRRYHVQAFRFIGNRVISEESLQRLLKPFTQLELDITDLNAARDQVTALYRAEGYINSGALLLPQIVEDNTIELTITEGKLAQVSVTTNGRFASGYFERRLLRIAQPTLNMKAIEQELQQMKQDPRIHDIDAYLFPTERRGFASMTLNVRERKPYWFSLALNNYGTPAIGEERVALRFGHENLSRWGDRLSLGLRATQGLRELDAIYHTPPLASDMFFSLSLKNSRSKIIESEFEDLDIEGRFSSYGLSINQPFWFGTNHKYTISLNFEYKESKSFLLGEEFSFSAGSEKGVARVSVLRLGQAWLFRKEHDVLAARLLISTGLDVLNATVHKNDLPDSKFTTFLGQFQWAHRFPWLNLTSIFRLDFQQSSEALLSMERFAMGGRNSVRGYRENALVRDSGWVSSLEWRLPLWQKNAKQVTGIFFIDGAYGRDEDRAEHEELASSGLGLIARFNKHINFELFVAEQFRTLATLNKNSLQDRGIHFQLEFRWP